MACGWICDKDRAAIQWALDEILKLDSLYRDPV